MKLMIASDIHGSEYYCKKLPERFEAEAADKLLLLGDILYHGPRNDLPRDYAPKAVINLLNPMKDKILCLFVFGRPYDLRSARSSLRRG